MEGNKLWFVSKKYGWGWVPVTWQGWVVVVGYVVVVLYRTGQWQEELTIENLGELILWTVLLITVCYRKGEKPRWRWGK